MDFEKFESELHFFGFFKEQMRLERRIFIKRAIKTHWDFVQKSLIKKSNITEEGAKRIEDKISEKGIEATIFAKFEDGLKEMEKLDEKHFTVPSNVSLYGNRKEFNEEDEKYLEEVCADLEKEFMRNSLMISALEEENAKFNELSEIIYHSEKTIEKLEEGLVLLDLAKYESMIAEVESTIEMSKNLL